MRKAVLIRFDPERYEALQEVAKRQERSVTSLIRLIVNEFLAIQSYSTSALQKPPPSKDWQSRAYGGKRGEA